MPLTSKQRSQLRGLASTEDTIIYIGKGDLNDNIIRQTADALKARELIKGKVQENSMLSPRGAAEMLAEATKSEVVQVIGSKFVLYKRNEQDPKIELVKTKK